MKGEAFMLHVTGLQHMQTCPLTTVLDGRASSAHAILSLTPSELHCKQLLLCKPNIVTAVQSELDRTAGTCGRSCLIEKEGSEQASAWEALGLAPRDTKSSSVSSDSPKLSVAMAISADAAERILSWVRACR